MSEHLTPLQARMTEPVSEETIDRLWHRIGERQARREWWTGASVGFVATTLILAIGSLVQGRGGVDIGREPLSAAAVASTASAGETEPVARAAATSVETSAAGGRVDVAAGSALVRGVRVMDRAKPAAGHGLTAPGAAGRVAGVSTPEPEPELKLPDRGFVPLFLDPGF